MFMKTVKTNLKYMMRGVPLRRFGMRTGAIVTAFLFLLTALMPVTAQADATTYFEGVGTQENPYLIESAADLAQMRDLVNSQTSPWADAGVTYKLTQNIDLAAYASDTIPSGGTGATGIGWTPIGYTGGFKGVFDGNGKTISRMYIYYANDGHNMGLFGWTDSTAVIKNLGVVKCDVTGYLVTGGLVGYSHCTIENCYVTGRVRGMIGACGGLVGKFVNFDTINTSQLANNYIKNCYTVCTITSRRGSGLVGETEDGTITNCYSAGAVYGSCGGIVGDIESFETNDDWYAHSTVQNCVALQMRNELWPGTYSGDTVQGRIWVTNEAESLSVTSGNYAWSGMTGLSSISPSDSGQDGANLDTSADCVAAIRNIGFTDFTEADLPKYITGDYFTGSGTEADPYRISTVDELEDLAFDINTGVNLDGKCFKLMNDIDLAGSYMDWSPIGSDTKLYNADDTYQFNGIFDGNGKVIRHLNNSFGYESTDAYGDLDYVGLYYMGLFGYVGSGGTVKNLSLTDVSLSGYNYFAGGIAGECDGVIDNCQVSGSIRTPGYSIHKIVTGMGDVASAPTSYVGGVVGAGFGPDFSISNCRATGQVGSPDDLPEYAGGVAAMVVSATYFNGSTSGPAGQVTDSSFNGSVFMGVTSGGLIAINYGTVLNCHTEGTIQSGLTGGHQAGFIGTNNGGLIENCYSTCTVTSPSDAYGFVDGNSGTIRYCYSTGQVIGGSYGAFGFAGGNTGTMEYCYETGDVTGDYQVAGFMGANTHLVGNDGVTANCYCTGAVSGTTMTYCGGFAAVNHSVTPLQNCIALNPSISGTGTYYLGRFVGRIVSSSQIPSLISDCYAWSGMTVCGSTVTGTPSDTTGGDLADWTAVRPALVAIGFKNVPRPAYIPLGVSTASAVTSADNAAFTVGSAGTFTVTTTGTPAASLTETGAMPSGVTFTDNNDGTATISGTPGAGTAGSYPITITATNGVGTDATQSFALTVNAAFVPVTGITGVPATATVGTDLTLTGTVAPADATNKTIAWSVKNAGTTGAGISGNVLSTTAAGAVTVTATIPNGLTATTDYTQDFTITVSAAPPVFVPVTGITGVPATATAGTDLTLTGTVAPANATNKTIAWSVKNAGTTGASISGNVLFTTAAGSVTVTATIPNGLTATTDYTQDFTITVSAAPPVFVPVTGITGVPTAATAGTDLTLTGTVAPANATNKTIAWSVKNAGTTGASISGNVLFTTAAGSVTVTAKITNGATKTTDYTQDFTITVSAAPPPFVPVTGITGVPAKGTAGTNLTLTGTVSPVNATNKDITWSVKTAGTTGASIDGNVLTATAAGTVTVTATIPNGLTDSSDFTQDFTIAIAPASAVPAVTAVSAGYNSILLSWSAVSGTGGYEIYRASSYYGRYTKAGAVTGGSTVIWTDTGLITGKTYYYKMRAYRTVNGDTVFGKYSAVTSAKPLLDAPASRRPPPTASGSPGAKWQAPPDMRYTGPHPARLDSNCSRPQRQRVIRTRMSLQVRLTITRCAPTTSSTGRRCMGDTPQLLRLKQY